jgi:hypothetical protein
MATSPTPPGLATEILTNESILAMLKVGLSEDDILVKIAATPARFDTRTEALGALKEAGASDRVLGAMIGKR